MDRLRRQVGFKFPPRVMNYSPSQNVNAIKRKKQVELCDKTGQILRTTFGINKSASKVITLGLDIQYEFLPSVVLSKPGQQGVKLPHYAFQNLLQNIIFISDYFDGSHDGRADVNLGPEEVVQFTKLHGNKAVNIKSNLAVSDKVFVCLTAPSWIEFRRILPLVMYVYQQLEASTVEAQKLYTNLKQAVETGFYGEETAGHTNFPALESYLDKLPIEDIGYLPTEETALNIERAFLEMKLFCMYDLSS